MAPPALPILLPLATTRPHHSEYILSITPHQQHQLVLTHPSPDISLVDAQSLTLLQQLKGGHVPGTTVSAVVTSASTALDIAVPGGTSAAVGGSGTTGDTSSIWSAGKDARAIRWDTRVDSGAQGPGMTIKANLRGQALPLLSLAAHHPSHPHLVICGTELASGSESHLVYYDTRNPTSPLYVHSSTHSDDIVQLRYLPPTRSFAPTTASSSSSPSPELLLLSASTDGLLALTNPLEEDEDEAFYGAEGGLGGSVARMGTYWAPPAAKSGDSSGTRPSLRVWARSDMDTFATFDIARGKDSGEVELQHRPGTAASASEGVWPGNTFRGRSMRLSGGAESGAVRNENSAVGDGADDGDVDYAAADQDPAVENACRQRKGKLSTDYLVDACPTLGLGIGGGAGAEGDPAVVAGNNNGDIVLMHHRQPSRRHSSESGAAASSSYVPTAYLLSPSGSNAAGGSATGGHGDVVRCLWHDVATGALYTGAEDGTLCGWQMPDRDELLATAKDHYASFGGFGDIEQDEDDDDEDSEGMDVDNEDVGEELSDADDEDLVWGREGKEDGKRRRAGGGEVWGGGAPGKRRRA